MTLYELYNLSQQKSDRGNKARRVLEQTHWFSCVAEFDPRTAEALPLSLGTVLRKVIDFDDSSPCSLYRDRLWHIVTHVRPSLEKIFRALNNSPRREHEFLPIQAVRELDLSSFLALSRRPGRNIREKLAGKPYMQAVRRVQSVDLPENRLLKACAKRLTELLEFRAMCWGTFDAEDRQFVERIQAWLYTDEARTIQRWDNMPPNNTLLSHRHYRAVWDAWRWLQTLDDDLDSDWQRFGEREKVVKFWQNTGRYNSNSDVVFAEQPCFFSYEQFRIDPWELHDKICKRLPLPAGKKLFTRRPPLLNVPVCVDLTTLQPQYDFENSWTPEQRTEEQPFTLLWQHWANKHKQVDIDLFDADGVWQHPDAITIGVPDLLFPASGDLRSSDILDRAARAFAVKLRNHFLHNVLLWLVPDTANDFALETVRRNLNIWFPLAEPLPRSIAAVFKEINYTKVRNGFSVLVIDDCGGKVSTTKIVAHHDKELAARVPETEGFYWERCPPVVLVSPPQSRVSVPLWTLDSKGEWQKPVDKDFPRFDQDRVALKSDSRIGKFDYLIYLQADNAPVSGGIRLHAMRLKAGDIPLWRDQIAELSIMVMEDGCYRRLHLVPRDFMAIKPIRGRAVGIPVSTNFTLPPGKKFYRFPLYQGREGEELGYYAILRSTAFPLKYPVECRLVMSFTYGADEPYRLMFTPLHGEFSSIGVAWQRMDEVIIDDASWPEFPQTKTWEDLTRWEKPGSDEASNLLEWMTEAVDAFQKRLYYIPRVRCVGTVTSQFKRDKNGDNFIFADYEGKNVFLHAKSCADCFSIDDVSAGDIVSFILQEEKKDGKIQYCGWNIASVEYIEPPKLREFTAEYIEKLQDFILKSLRYPFITIWSQGRSLRDADVPKEFLDAVTLRLKYLTDMQIHPDIPNEIKSEVFFLLACMHKDMPTATKSWWPKNFFDFPRSIGFALGNVSESWQKTLLSRQLEDLSKETNIQFVLSIFASAIWRNPMFIEKLTHAELHVIILAVKKELTLLANDHILISAKERLVRSLELLLGLLRTRGSKNSEIKLLLQPYQNITKKLAKSVEKISDIVLAKRVPLSSYIQIELPKPQNDLTPNLLYALRLYLTGNDGSDVIHIASIKEG